jgi:hypothetical protein
MPINSYSDPDNTIITGELTVQTSNRYGLTGVSFDNGKIVSDGLGDLALQNLLVNGTFTAPNSNSGYQVFNAKTYGAVGNGIHDDTAAINAAIVAANAVGGGVAYLPAGTYATSSAILMSYNFVTLAGAGNSCTILKPMAGANFDVITNPIPPDGTTVYNVKKQVIRDLMIDGSNMTGTTAGQGNGIHSFATTHCQFMNLLFKNIPNWGIMNDHNSASDSYDNLFFRCEWDSCAAGLRLEAGEGSTMLYCLIYGANNTTAANQNTFFTPDNNAYAFYGHAQSVQTSHCFFQGGGTITHELVRLQGSSCQFLINQFDAVTNTCIKMYSVNETLIGNLFSSSATTSGNMIEMTTGANSAYIAGNLSYGNKYGYAINESAALTGNIITGNQFQVGTSGIFSLNAGSNTRTSMNPGYNPVGPITSPAVPLTTVAYTNKLGVDCTVFINGGTVTVVAIGGTATGQTTGCFKIPVGQTITLTYSVAPTWTWFGD